MLISGEMTVLGAYFGFPELKSDVLGAYFGFSELKSDKKSEIRQEFRVSGSFWVLISGFQS